MMPPKWVTEQYKEWLFPELADGFGRRPVTSRQQVACLSGGFFEQLTIQLMGGMREESPPETWHTYPDIIFWRDLWDLEYDLLIEVKGIGRHIGTYISLDQIERYAALEEEVFPFTNAKVYYLFYLHGARDITKSCETDRDVLQYLGATVLGAILIPLHLVNEIARWGKGHSNDYWSTPCSDGSPDWIVRMSGAEMYRWCRGKDPRSWMEKHSAERLWDFNTKDWEVTRVSMPPCQVHKYSVVSHPLIMITERVV